MLHTIQLLIYFAICTSKTITLHDKKELYEFKGYCNPKTTKVKELGKLKKVITIFRHGDRAPLTKDLEWEKKECLNCVDGRCSKTSCASGMLSMKGVAQTKAIGTFIRENYVPHIVKKNDDISVLGYSTGFSRTLGSLNNALIGLNKRYAEKKIDVDINDAGGCGTLQYLVSTHSFPHLSTPKSTALNFDKIMTSVCNPVNYTCNSKSENCSLSEIKDFLLTSADEYGQRMKKIRENIKVNGVNFSYLAKFLLETVAKEQDLILIAAHDSVLNKILNGLNINYNEIPPYASTLFIEIWESKEKKDDDIIKVVFNGKEEKFGLYNESKVQKGEFVKYLKLFSAKHEELKKICYKHKNGKLGLMEAIERAKNQFGLIDKAITNEVNRVAMEEIKESTINDDENKTENDGYFDKLLNRLENSLFGKYNLLTSNNLVESKKIDVIPARSKKDIKNTETEDKNKKEGDGKSEKDIKNTSTEDKSKKKGDVKSKKEGDDKSKKEDDNKIKKDDDNKDKKVNDDKEDKENLTISKREYENFKNYKKVVKANSDPNATNTILYDSENEEIIDTPKTCGKSSSCSTSRSSCDSGCSSSKSPCDSGCSSSKSSCDSECSSSKPPCDSGNIPTSFSTPGCLKSFSSSGCKSEKPSCLDENPITSPCESKSKPSISPCMEQEITKAAVKLVVNEAINDCEKSKPSPSSSCATASLPKPVTPVMPIKSSCATPVQRPPPPPPLIIPSCNSGCL